MSELIELKPIAPEYLYVVEEAVDALEHRCLDALKALAYEVHVDEVVEIRRGSTECGFTLGAMDAYDPDALVSEFFLELRIDEAQIILLFDEDKGGVHRLTGDYVYGREELLNELKALISAAQ